MKRKLIAAGIVSPLLLAICVVSISLAGVTGWLILKPEDSPQKIRKIATVGPLLLPAATVTLKDEEASGDAPTTEVIVQPQREITGSKSASPPAEATEMPVSTPNVEEVLGFALPPDTVNSVTQEGVASRLVIPKLELDAPVMLSPIENQTWKVSHLEQAVGHLEGTASPGSNSNIVLAGHVTLAAGGYGPFAGLAQLAPGDSLIVYEGDQEFQYVVDGYQVVDRTAIEVTHPTDSGQITLITCNNWNRAENRYDERIVVKGHLVQK